MKKILYISGSELPSKYANSVHVMKMCQAFAKNDAEVTLIAKRTNNDELHKLYNVDDIFNIKTTKNRSNRLFTFIVYNFHCLKEIIKHTDVIYMRYFYPLVWVLLFKKKVTIELHGFPKSTFIKWLFKRLFKSSNLIGAVFITHKLLEIFNEEFNIPDHKCVVLPDCADVPDKTNDNVNTKEIGYVGHLYEGRGIEIIIEIAYSLPNFNFHIIGGRDEEIIKYKKISPNNIKYYGFVSQSDLSKIYGEFSIALAPYQFKVGTAEKGSDSSKWMSPMKIFEYMSYKKAIVMSDLPVLHEIGTNNVHFIYVKPNDVQEWVNAILKIHNNSRLFEDLKKNTYSYFIDHYTWAGRAREILKMINI